MIQPISNPDPLGGLFYTLVCFSQVLVLLYYHSVINNHVDLNQLEYKFEVGGSLCS